LGTSGHRDRAPDWFGLFRETNARDGLDGHTAQRFLHLVVGRYSQLPETQVKSPAQNSKPP